MDAAQCFQKFSKRLSKRKRVSHSCLPNCQPDAEVCEKYNCKRSRSNSVVEPANVQGTEKNDNILVVRSGNCGAMAKARGDTHRDKSIKEAPLSIADALGARATGWQRKNAINSAVSLMKGIRAKAILHESHQYENNNVEIVGYGNKLIDGQGRTQATNQSINKASRQFAKSVSEVQISNSSCRKQTGLEATAEDKEQNKKVFQAYNSDAVFNDHHELACEKVVGSSMPTPCRNQPDKAVNYTEYFSTARQHLRNTALAANHTRKGEIDLCSVLVAKLHGVFETKSSCANRRESIAAFIGDKSQSDEGNSYHLGNQTVKQFQISANDAANRFSTVIICDELGSSCAAEYNKTLSSTPTISGDFNINSTERPSRKLRFFVSKGQHSLPEKGNLDLSNNESPDGHMQDPFPDFSVSPTISNAPYRHPYEQPTWLACSVPVSSPFANVVHDTKHQSGCIFIEDFIKKPPQVPQVLGLAEKNQVQDDYVAEQYNKQFTVAFPSSTPEYPTCSAQPEFTLDLLEDPLYRIGGSSTTSIFRAGTASWLSRDSCLE